MNENIEKVPNVPPFVRFVASAVPMVFDNSLSYYECLAALTKYMQDVADVVNNNGTVTEEYIQLTNEMKAYMDNYFDNLDVQEEINNKLDEMVADGSFQLILNTYVAPKLEELNENLNGAITTEANTRQTADQALQSQISSLSSGSPIAVASTSAMTDTSRVYVNTTDGKWYYYDGNSWEIGGTYQSTGVAEDSIDLTMLDSSVFKNATKSTSTFAKGGISGGVIVESNNRVYSVISDITACDTIYIKINDPTLIPTIFCRFNGDHYLSNFQTSDSHQVASLGNGAYMLTRGNYTNLKIVWRKPNASGEFTDDEVAALSMDIYQTTQYQEKDNYINSLSSVKWEMGGITDSGALVTNTIRARSLQINIDTNIGYRYFKIDGATDDMQVAYIATYLNGSFVASYNKVVSGTPVWFSTGHLKIYNDGSFNQLRISFSKFNNDDFTNDEVNALSVKCITKEITKSKWDGKKYVALGDSITYGFIPRNYTGYPGQLDSYAKLTAEALGMTFVNAGNSGNTVALTTGGGTPMCERYTSLDNDADLITVMGGTNDIRKDVPLGQMSDRTENTFYGALHILLGGLYKKYFIDQGTTAGKNKHIVVITPPKLLRTSGGTSGGTGTLYDLEPWCNAMKEVAAYYSIPVLDMYNLSNINPHLNQTVHGTVEGYTDYYNPYITDGTHPTQEGADIMAKVLEGYLDTIV